MTCKNCGAVLTEGARFCPTCGSAVEIETKPHEEFFGVHPLQQRFSSLLVDAKEKIISVLGNSLAQTFLSTGMLGNGFAVLTDKRVYFKGKCLYRNGKWLRYQQEERTVDVNDITGTGFVHNKCLWALIAAIFAAIVGLAIAATTEVNGDAEMAEDAAFSVVMGGWIIIAAVILFLIYRSQNRSLFEISFAGGRIAFDLQWASLAEAQEFQKQIVRAKQTAKSGPDTNTDQKDDVVASPPPDTLEQLKRAFELYQQGAITKEQYEQMRKNLLG